MDRSENVFAPLNHIPAEVVCAGDYETLAAQFIASDRYAYIAGGSAHEVTLQKNEKAFSDYSIFPRLPRDVSHAHTSVELCGQTFKHPTLLAPVAYQLLAHPEAELATAYAAESTDTCMVASTLSCATLEQIAEKNHGDRWFQLYFQPNEQDTDALVSRAIAAGYQAIVVTVDAAIQAPGLRAMRAGFQFPQNLVPANIRHQQRVEISSVQGGQSRVFLSYMQNAPTKEKLKRLIQNCPLPVIIKGILHPEDASEMKAIGAAGVIVSNHGGRTLDGAPSSLEMLPAIRQVVGSSFPLLLDSGVRSGSDIFKAIALGADAVLIGRLQVYALSVAGALGVAHMIKLLREELELTMAMTGCASIDDIKATCLLRDSEN